MPYACAMNQVLVSALRYSQGPDATAGLATEMVGLGLRGPVCIIASRSAQKELQSTWIKLLRLEKH